MDLLTSIRAHGILSTIDRFLLYAPLELVRREQSRDSDKRRKKLPDLLAIHRKEILLDALEVGRTAIL